MNNYLYLTNIFAEEGDIHFYDKKDFPFEKDRINIFKISQGVTYLNLKEYPLDKIKKKSQAYINCSYDELDASCELFAKNSSENLLTEFRIIIRGDMELSPKERENVNKIEDFFINDGYERFVPNLLANSSIEITSNSLVFFYYSYLKEFFWDDNNREVEIVVKNNEIYGNEKSKSLNESFGMYFNCPNGTYDIYRCGVEKKNNNQIEEKEYGYVIRLRDKKTKKLDFMKNE